MDSRRFIKQPMALMLCVCMCITTGCMFGGRGGPSPESVVQAGFDEETVRNMLETELNVMIRAANERHEGGESEIHRAPPYFFFVKEHFPEGPGQFRLTVRRVSGNRSQFEGSAAVPSHRYITRYHLSRAAAARDQEFVREEGIMRYSFTRSGARWVKKSSYFEPGVVKVLEGNEWTEVPFVADRFVEDEPSFWQRWLGFIF